MHVQRSHSHPFLLLLMLAALLQGRMSESLGAELNAVPEEGRPLHELRLSGDPRQTYVLEASSDLRNWAAVAAGNSASGEITWSDYIGPRVETFFYRARNGASADGTARLEARFRPAPGATLSQTNAAGELTLTLTNAIALEFHIRGDPSAMSARGGFAARPLESPALQIPGTTLLGAVEILPLANQIRLPGQLILSVPEPIIQPGSALMWLVADPWTGEAALRGVERHDSSLLLKVNRACCVALVQCFEAAWPYFAQHEPANLWDRTQHRAALWKRRVVANGGVPSAADRDELQALLRSSLSRDIINWLPLAEQAPSLLTHVSETLEQWESLTSQTDPAAIPAEEQSATQAQLRVAQFSSWETQSGWRFLDLNHDARVDREDKTEIFKFGGWLPQRDVNRDGRRDLDDFWAWVLYAMQWDINGDGAVSHEDFIPPAPIQLPAADTNAAAAIVARVFQDVSAKVSADLESRLRVAYATNLTEAGMTDSRFFELVGMSSLVQRNLEAAQWSFIRSYQADTNREAALANLAFTLSHQRQYADAMKLLATALAMNPKAAATHNNIAWIYSRHGQLAEAEHHYREAIRLEPRMGQYHLNLGGVSLRRGYRASAERELQLASQCSPLDGEALLAATAIHPATPPPLADFQRQYEKTRLEYIQQDPEYDPPHWEEMPVDEKINEIRTQISDRLEKQEESAVDQLEDETLQKGTAVFSKIRPDWVNVVPDLAKWFAGFPTVFEQLVRLEEGAEVKADEIGTQYERRKAAEFLSMDPMILQLALTQAQQDMLSYTDPTAARQAFEKGIHDYYEVPMQQAEWELAHAQGNADLELDPEFDSMKEFSAGLGFMAITMAGIADPEGYGKGMDGVDPGSGRDPNVQVEVEPSYGVGLAVVQVEYNPVNGEVKLQVGQGLIVAGTWSPASGFGFQAGAGIDFEEGPFGVEAATYLKFGSDGSISVVSETGPNIVGVKAQVTTSRVLRAATHEPVGSL